MLLALEEKVDPRHTALLVIDMQNDFCHDAGASAIKGGDVAPAQAIVSTLQNLIAHARQVEMPVIFIRAVHNRWTDSAVRLEQRRHPGTENCVEGTWGAEWYGVAPMDDDPVVTKHRYSAFINTDLDRILRAQGIKTLIVTGVATNVCVESTARDGFMLDYYVVLVDDCCASGDRDLHQATVRNIQRSFGVVASAAELATALPVAPVPIREAVTA